LFYSRWFFNHSFFFSARVCLLKIVLNVSFKINITVWKRILFVAYQKLIILWSKYSIIHIHLSFRCICTCIHNLVIKAIRSHPKYAMNLRNVLNWRYFKARECKMRFCSIDNTRKPIFINMPENVSCYSIFISAQENNIKRWWIRSLSIKGRQDKLFIINAYCYVAE
jgi:hypothetical protein